jgi:hypothetical protein
VHFGGVLIFPNYVGMLIFTPPRIIDILTIFPKFLTQNGTKNEEKLIFGPETILM